jgi:DNA-binding NarL/FixJ family response regulator
MDARRTDEIDRHHHDVDRGGGVEGASHTADVMIVADHDRLAMALAAHLAASPDVTGVVRVHSTDDVVWAAETWNPAVVVFDEQASADVWDLCHRLAERRPATILIILGNGLGFDEAVRARLVGADAYVAKALTSRTVRDAVEDALRARAGAT